MSCAKPYGDNFLGKRSSTKVLYQPGGHSSIGSLLFGGGGGDDAAAQQQQQSQTKENTQGTANVQRAQQMQSQTQAQPSDCKSDAEKVREFTYEAGQPCPERPQMMDVDEVNFITKMILDELLELYATVMPPQMAKNAMKKMLDEAKSLPKINVGPNCTDELIAEQGDALADIYYYSLNCMAKKGVNISKIFNLVHNANMAKRDPQTGKFIKRKEDGKILKPAGWRAPDVCAEIKRQSRNGAWE